MFKLYLLALTAKILGLELTYSARFYDGSSTRGRTLWETLDLGDAMQKFGVHHRLHREKKNGLYVLTIETPFKEIDWFGHVAHATSDNLDLPFADGVHQRVQDGEEGIAVGSVAQEADHAEAARAEGGGSAARHHVGTEAPAVSEEPVARKLDLTDLGIRK